MHSEPPRAANPKQEKRAPKIRRRQLDALFADIPREERRKFFAKAYKILGKAADEILNDPDGVWGDAVPKFREDRGLTLMKMASEIAGIAERADKREEPYRKIMLGLIEGERPTVQIVQVGQFATSPAMELVLGPPPPELVAGKQVIDVPAPEPSAPLAESAPTIVNGSQDSGTTSGQAEEAGAVSDPFDWG